MAKNAAKLISSILNIPMQAVKHNADTCIGGVAEALCARKSVERVGISLTVTHAGAMEAKQLT